MSLEIELLKARRAALQTEIDMIDEEIKGKERCENELRELETMEQDLADKLFALTLPATEDEEVFDG